MATPGSLLAARRRLLSRPRRLLTAPLLGPPAGLRRRRSAAGRAALLAPLLPATSLLAALPRTALLAAELRGPACPAAGAPALPALRWLLARWRLLESGLPALGRLRRLLPAELVAGLTRLTRLLLSAVRAMLAGLAGPSALLAGLSRLTTVRAGLPRWAALPAGPLLVGRLSPRRPALSSLWPLLLPSGLAGSLLASWRRRSAAGLLAAGLPIVDLAPAAPSVARSAPLAVLSAALSTSILGAAVLPAHGLVRARVDGSSEKTAATVHDAGGRKRQLGRRRP